MRGSEFKEVDKPCSEDTEPAIEVLVVSSQKGPELMFPKVDAPLSHLICNLLYHPMLYDQPQSPAFFRQGGWELDESMPEAASREAFEEAGVRGNLEVSSRSLRLHSPYFPAIVPPRISPHTLFPLQCTLGKWSSKGDDKIHFMYALRVTEVLQQWPEMGARERKWVSKKQASHADPSLSTVEFFRKVIPKEDLGLEMEKMKQSNGGGRQQGFEQRLCVPIHSQVWRIKQEDGKMEEGQLRPKVFERRPAVFQETRRQRSRSPLGIVSREIPVGE
ncbi:hypothetical protein GW17_00030003 [Ensete ventricosum]|nr:hypothetical protein GW17_00030003 [Ensete ventricosum]